MMYILRDFYRYVFKFIPWVIIGFLISFIFSINDVNALEYNSVTIGTDTLDIFHTNGSTNTELTYSLVNSPIYAAFLTTPVSNTSVVASQGIQIRLNTEINNLKNYDNFSLIIGGNNLNWTNSVSLRSMNGICTMQSVPALYTNAEIVNTGYNFAQITCKIDKTTLTNELATLYIPFTPNNYIDTVNRFYVQRLWTVWNDSAVGTDIIQQQQQTNEKLDDINDSINSSDTDNNNVSDTIDNINIGNEGVITQLITMPITLFTNILNSINGSCTTFNLGNLLGTNLSLPCINLENYLGSNLWSVIDVLLSGFLAWGISKKIKQVFEQLTNLREGDILND